MIVYNSLCKVSYYCLNDYNLNHCKQGYEFHFSSWQWSPTSHIPTATGPLFLEIKRAESEDDYLTYFSVEVLLVYDEVCCIFAS